MLILTLCSFAMLSVSILTAIKMASNASAYDYTCGKHRNDNYGYAIDVSYCQMSKAAFLWQFSGEFGGFRSSIYLATLPADSLASEITTFFIANGAQLLYSAIYLLLIYNITLISMEHDWGKFDATRRRLRCSIVKGHAFDQSYFLQLPRNIIVPIMIFSSTMHWLLGQAISSKENIFESHGGAFPHSQYDVTFAITPLWLATIAMVFMTAVCWWAFTYTREGFIPQMYGSMRVLCASTSELHEFGTEGVKWGECEYSISARQVAKPSADSLIETC